MDFHNFYPIYMSSKTIKESTAHIPTELYIAQ